MADPRRRLILVATLIAIAFGSTGASSPIFFPVVVTDGRGQPVTGLGPSAFTVRDGARSLDVASLLAEDGPASVVILLDASMLVDEFELARAARMLSQVVSGLDPRSEYAVVAIAGGGVSPGWRAARDVDEVLAHVGRTHAQGIARVMPLLDPLLQALRIVESGKYARRAVLVMSAGAARSSVTRWNELDRAFRNSPALVTAIVPRVRPGFVQDPELMELAEVTGGRVVLVKSDRGWEDAARDIVSDIRHHYLVGVVPSTPASGARWRGVKVSVDVPAALRNGSVRVRHRMGYSP